MKQPDNMDKDTGNLAEITMNYSARIYGNKLCGKYMDHTVDCQHWRVPFDLTLASLGKLWYESGPYLESGRFPYRLAEVYVHRPQLS